MLQIRILSIAGAFLMSATAGMAHHPLGGKVPETALNGLLSGLGHPIIGLDHAAFIVAAGALTALAGRGFSVVAVFVASSLLGTVLMWNGLGLSLAELGVALSLIASGVLLFRQDWISMRRIVPFFALAGIVHGMALGEAVIGAEKTPVAFYLLGIGCCAMIMAAIAFAGMRWMLGRDDSVKRYTTMGFACILLMVGTLGLVSNGLAMM